MDSRVLRINKNKNDSLHLNDSLRKIPGQGMPVYKQDTFGDLFIRFNVVIPKSIEPNMLIKLKEIFDDTPEELGPTYTSSFMLENVSETDLEDFGSSDESEDDSGDDEDSDISVSSASTSSSQGKQRFKR